MPGPQLPLLLLLQLQLRLLVLLLPLLHVLVLLELLPPKLVPSLPSLLLLVLFPSPLLVASLLLLPDLKFFRNLDFSVLRNGGQALMDGGQALCHNLIFKIRKHVQRREDEVRDPFL